MPLLCLLSLSLSITAQATSPHDVLAMKLREAIAESDLPAMGATIVRNGGNDIYSSAAGIRKVGASGPANAVQPTDRFDIGSVGKVFTGYLVGTMVGRSPRFQWNTTIRDVFPALPPDRLAVYGDMPVTHLMVHGAGFPYNPKTEPADQWAPTDPAGFTNQDLMARRLRFVQAAVADAPDYTPGAGFKYGGGSIIVAAMMERVFAQRYEDLMTQNVLNPLGMSNSRFGRTSVGDLDGPWEHALDANGFWVPDTRTHELGFDFQSHAPAGTLAVSAADMGKFLQDNLIPFPRVGNSAVRDEMHQRGPVDQSNYVISGWGTTMKNSLDARLSHDGDNGTCYAMAELYRSQGTGFSAFTNASSTLGKSAVWDMINTAQVMNDNWNELFGSGDRHYDLVHQRPAVVRLGDGTQLAFTRRHNGHVVMHRTSPGNPWTASTPLGAVYTSGLGAAAAWNGPHVYVAGRGTDNRIWVYRSESHGTTWANPTPIPNGTFKSSPAVATSDSGAVVHVVAEGMDDKFYLSTSRDGGRGWSGWIAMGNGTFTSAPALVCGPSGSGIQVFGRGRDHRIYRTSIANEGAAGSAGWVRLSNEFMTSSPAAVRCGDGLMIRVVARDTGRMLKTIDSWDGGNTWPANSVWTAIPGGRASTSSPAAVRLGERSSDFAVVTLGDNYRLWRTPYAGTWSPWTQIATDLFL